MKKIKSFFKNISLFFLHRLFCLFPLKKRVVFTSFGGKQYSCNPRAISESLTLLFPKVKQIWILNSKPRFQIPNITIVTGKIRRIFYYATSKILVDNSILPPVFKRRKKQVYVETWHGDCSFKKIGMDSSIRFDKDSANMKYQFNYAITGSKFGEDYVFKKAIPFKGSLLKVGSPRNDILFKNDEPLKQTIKRELGIPENAGVLLYAPTFRDSHKANDTFDIGFDIKNILSSLELHDPSHRRWIALLRLHSAEKASFSSVFSETIIDATEYYDMANILYISDFCITDYSSCAIDFVLGNKISILYHFDKKHYAESDRELLFDDKELPFLIANDEDDLKKILSSIFYLNVKNYVDKIKTFYGIYDNGTASLSVANFIKKHLDE